MANQYLRPRSSRALLVAKSDGWKVKIKFEENPDEVRNALEGQGYRIGMIG